MRTLKALAIAVALLPGCTRDEQSRRPSDNDLRAKVPEAPIAADPSDPQPYPTRLGRDDPAQPPSEPFYVGGDVAAPERLSGESPRFDLLEGRYSQSFCIVTAVVSRTGEVENVRFLKPRDTDPAVQRLVTEALATWRFKPALRQGKPVAVHYTLSISHCPRRRVEGAA